ncbi:MAG: type II secretion system F family protein [Alphaproteobacteria bacterium]|nr:type II secretion system F family protein [Alphaproteobacteria bacterium]
MREHFIDIISFGSIFLVMAIYVFFVYYRKIKNEKFDWKKRISASPSLLVDEKVTSTSLLKDQSYSEQHFKSKLVRVEGLREWLQHGGITVSPSLFIAIFALVGLISGSIFYFILHLNGIISVLLGVGLSLMIPWILVLYLTSRQTNLFLNDFPTALDTMRRALRAGYSADRTMEMVAEQQAGLVGEVFRVITEKMRLGESAETVMAEMSNRLGINEFRMLSIVFILQRETGGSLAEAMESYAKIIRARTSLRKKIKALSAEVRVTAMILSAVPFFILGAVYITSPRYLDPLFFTERGNHLLLVGGAMLVVGIGIMFRMAYKEVY